MIVALCLPVVSVAQQDQEDAGDALGETSLIGHDPRLFSSSYRGGVAARRPDYSPQRTARGRPLYYSQRILGRLSDASRNGRLSSFLPPPDTSGLYWMRQPTSLAEQTAAVAPPAAVVPRGAAGLRMSPEEWRAADQAAPLAPLWTLLQAPRRRSRRAAHY